MSICVDGPALDATESINVWLPDSEPPSMPVTLTLLLERLTFLFDWGKNNSTYKFSLLLLLLVRLITRISQPAE